jgi:hypothetical protein
MDNTLCKKLFPHEDVASLNNFYGDPRGANGDVDAKWFKANTVKWTPPYPLYYSDGLKTPLKTLYLHKKVVSVYTEAFTEVKQHFSESDIEKYRLNISGGTFCYRLMRGGDRLSVHSWAIAIDIDPGHNPFPSSWRKGMLNPEFAAILEKHGLLWRGRPGDNDPMHFQAAWRD